MSKIAAELQHIIIDVAKSERTGDGFVLEAYSRLRERGVEQLAALAALDMFVMSVITHKQLKNQGPADAQDHHN